MSLHSAPESLFWYWIAERHGIFLRRQAGQPKPWTDDPIFQKYKFTNPFRENDTGTVWLRENFLQPHKDDVLNLLAFNICWYRMFNWWGTGEFLGWKTDWDAKRIKTDLTARLLCNEQVFTGAHIVYSPPGKPKIDAIVDVCAELFFQRGNISHTARYTRSLQKTYEELRKVHCVGGFMAYEMVTDMRHTALLEDASDIMTWANLGPGAKRGLQRLGMPAANQEQGCESMGTLLSNALNARITVYNGEKYSTLPELEMRDIEHSLCEFDKYCRVKFGEGEPRSKYAGV